MVTAPNTNIKHRYTDPLAAMWMAKHHNMKFKSGRGSNLYYDGGADFRVENTSGVYAGEYFYVHPDSLHLLEPQYRDLLVGPNTMAAMFYMDDSDRETSKRCRIIARNGIPFMWPESEEV